MFVFDPRHEAQAAISTIENMRGGHHLCILHIHPSRCGCSALYLQRSVHGFWRHRNGQPLGHRQLDWRDASSSPNTELLFTASDFLATNNDLGNPFSLNRVTLRAFSSQLVTGSLAGNQSELTGAEPTVIAEGPGGSSFGDGGNGLGLAPTSGTTTFGGDGNGNLSIGVNGISGTGGIRINRTGAGAVSLSGANTFAGGVALDAGPLFLNSAGALGGSANVLTVNGGRLRGVFGSTIANTVVLNADLVFTGALTLNGPISGNGGIYLIAENASYPSLTLGGALSFGGTVTFEDSVRRPDGGTLTLTSSASLGAGQIIKIGNNGTLAITGSGVNTRIPNTNPLVLNGGRISVAGTSAGSLMESFGEVNASGLSSITLAGGATNNRLAFGGFNRQDNASLYARGPWDGNMNVLTFSRGLPNVSDPQAPGGANTGQYLGVVPFAAGNLTSTALDMNGSVHYDPVNGVRHVSPTNPANFQQIGSGGTFDDTDLRAPNVAARELQ